jgi:spermidine/putrescine-binding protein
MLSAISVPFCVGLIFGYQYSLKEKLSKVLLPAKTEKLVVVVPEGSLPADLIESYQVEHNVEVTIKTYSETHELDSFLNSDQQDADLVLVSSVQVPQMIKEGLIKPLQIRQVPNIENIANDFLDLPTDPGAKFSIPLLWGVREAKNERAQLERSIQEILSKEPLYQQVVPAQVIPTSMFLSRLTNSKKYLSQRSALWVRSFVIPVTSKADAVAYSFLNYFLEPEVALELSSLTMQSSTNRTIENSELNESLKPSHLRRQKLAEILKPIAR